MIYISSSCVKHDLIKDSVEELAGLGFRNIELSGGTRYYEGYLDDLLSLKHKYSLNYLVHNYFPPQAEDFVLNLASSDLSIYEKSGNLINRAIEISDRLGAGLYCFHPGYAVEVRPVRKGLYFDYSRLKDYEAKVEKERLFYERFDHLLQRLPGHDFAIAIENLFPFSAEEDYSLFSRPAEITAFLLKYLDRRNVGLLLDLGHLSVASHFLGFDKREFVSRLFRDFPRKIFEIHMSENDGTGDHHHSNGFDSWQVSLLRDHPETIGDIPVTLEWFGSADIMEKYKDFLSLTGLSEAL